MDDRWITPAEAAVRLRLSKRRVLEYCTAGKIRTERPNGPKGSRVLLAFDVENLRVERNTKTEKAKTRALETMPPSRGLEPQLIEVSQRLQDIRNEIFHGIPAGTNVVYGTSGAGKTEAFLLPLLCQWVGLEEASRMVKLPRGLLRSRILAGKLRALRVHEVGEPKEKKAKAGDCWRVKVSDLAELAGEIYSPAAESAEAIGV